MLDYYFKQPWHLSRLRQGPFAEYLDRLAQELHSKGYCFKSSQRTLSLIGRFSIFAQEQGVDSASGINEALVEQFRKERLAPQGPFKYAPRALRHMLDYLRSRGVIAMPIEKESYDPDRDLLVNYDVHLCKIRGLTKSTRQGCLRSVRVFLRWYREQHPDRVLGDLLGRDVMDFLIVKFSEPHSITWKKRLCCNTRSYLRYLRWEGIISHNLDRTVPTIPHWQLAEIPRHLPWEKVRELIDCVNTDTPDGKRDKAVILLIATLGMRSQEVHALQLSHILWRLSEIHLPRTKSLRERVLPLTSEVGEALTDYMLNGRPTTRRNEVFILFNASGLASAKAGSISGIIRKRLIQAGIKAPGTGAHMLRHSLATQMINTGVSISHIANILEHASIKTTAIYTKVDVVHLASVALPFWKGEEQ